MGASQSRLLLEQSASRLLNEDVPPRNQEFWGDLWRTRASFDEILTFFTPNFVKSLREKHPNNLATLFTQAVLQLHEVRSQSIPIYFAQGLNSVRILTTILPPLLSNQNDIMFHDLCWKKYAEEGPIEQLESKQTDVDEDSESQALGLLIIHTAMHLLFMPGFSIDTRTTSALGDQEKAEIQKRCNANPLEVQNPSFIWISGVKGNDEFVFNTNQFDTNRIEVLRLLLIALSSPLYSEPSINQTYRDMWYQTITSISCPNTSALFYSLLNIVLSYDPYGWGIPYGSVIIGNLHEKLVAMSLQVLLVLLDAKKSFSVLKESSETQESTESQNSETKSSIQPDFDQYFHHVEYNVFRHLLYNITSLKDLEFIFRGCSRLLNNIHEAENSYLPGSYMKIEWYEEMLVLLWKIIDENPLFTTYLLKYADITQILVPICYIMFEFRKDVSKVGLIHTATFILLKLSGDRNFGVKLNQPYRLSLPINFPIFAGNHIDLLVIVLHKLVVNGQEKFSALYHCFLTIICNISPYTKHLCLVASVKLVNLFELFTSPRFLYAAETNHQYVSLLLEIFNNIIQYQYEGNPHLIYSIIRRKEAFDKLAHLTLPAAIQAAATTKVERQEHPIHVTTQVNEDGKQVNEDEKQVNEDDNDEKNDDEELNESKSPYAHRQKTAKFIPTEQWLNSVKSELPLNCIMRLLQNLAPQIDQMIESVKNADEIQVIEFIQTTTMVGLLPVPHPIITRKYQPNEYTASWFSNYLWGIIFLKNQSPLIFDAEMIKLFKITYLQNETK